MNKELKIIKSVKESIIRGLNSRVKFGRMDAKQRGQSLVEMVVAMSFMTIGILGVFAVFSQSIGLNRIAANQYIAANLAAEGIEVTKNILDANAINGRPWNVGVNVNGDFGVQYNSTVLNKSKAGSVLLFDAATGRYSYDTGTQTGFRRTVTITNNAALDEIKVVSRVYWTDRGGIDFEVNLEDHFRAWRAP